MKAIISDREIARQWTLAQEQGWTPQVFAKAIGQTTQNWKRRLQTLTRKGFFVP